MYLQNSNLSFVIRTRRSTTRGRTFVLRISHIIRKHFFLLIPLSPPADDADDRLSDQSLSAGSDVINGVRQELVASLGQGASQKGRWGGGDRIVDR